MRLGSTFESMSGWVAVRYARHGTRTRGRDESGAARTGASARHGARAVWTGESGDADGTGRTGAANAKSVAAHTETDRSH